MKIRNICLFLFMVLLLFAGPAAGEALPEEETTMGTLLTDLYLAYQNPSEASLARVDADVEILDDEVARSVAAHWKKVYLDPGYKLYCWGKDDPAEIPVEGKHAFVILGYQLQDGEMTDELKGRCDAAAAAAQAFTDSVIVCSGGATGGNNPEAHTEAGLMKAWLTERHGLDPGRIHTDESAMTTAENALNTMVILQELGVESYTIVTSSYHQRWGQVLYNLVAALYGRDSQYSPVLVGNFCFETEPEESRFGDDARIAVSQAARILDVKLSLGH